MGLLGELPGRDAILYDTVPYSSVDCSLECVELKSECHRKSSYA